MLFPKRSFSSVLVAAGFWIMSMVGSAGSLTPPGPPGSTMKTIAEVEPRTAISAIPTTITQPGAYYLTGNLSGITGHDGIVVTTGCVSLDLMGFTLRGGSGSGIGIAAHAGCADIAVFNGCVTGWGDVGVRLYEAKSSRIISVHASNNYGGIAAGNACLVQDCTASSNTQDGLYLLNGCIARNCVAQANGNNGIAAWQNCIVDTCTALDNSQNGISVLSGCSIVNCQTWGNRFHGIEVNSHCSVTGNLSRGNGQNTDRSGIYGIVGNRIENNNVTENARGLQISGGGNLIVRNSARDNPSSGPSANFDIAPGNSVGPIVNSSSIITNNNPNANFEY